MANGKQSVSTKYLYKHMNMEVAYNASTVGLEASGNIYRLFVVFCSSVVVLFCICYAFMLWVYDFCALIRRRSLGS